MALCRNSENHVDRVDLNLNNRVNVNIASTCVNIGGYPLPCKRQHVNIAHVNTINMKVSI